MTRKTYFTSDLHLFARHSDGRRYLGAIASKASGAAAFVLGGDIFDFRWAARATLGEAVDEAVDWLAELAIQCPECHFYFLLGNHDSHQAFTIRLAELVQNTDNMSWHRFYVRMGSNVFLHGDVAERKMTAEVLSYARSRWTNRKKRGRLPAQVYDLAVRTKLHKPVPYLVYPKKLVARRILVYLKHIGQGPQNGVKNIYFGHTHRALQNYQYGGLTFHNGGAPIRGLRFRILEAAVL